MGFAVLHINKASGNDAAMSAHVERTIEPKMQIKPALI
jgi:hypothetical protein